MEYQAFLNLNAAVVTALDGVVVKNAQRDHYSTWADVLVDGVGLHLSYDYDAKDRISVSVNWPANGRGESISFDRIRDKYGDVAPRISIASTKTPEKIAADIKRRFLEVARPLYAKALERAAGDDDYTAKLKAMQAKLCAAGGGRMVNNGGGDYFHGLPQGFEIKYTSPTSDRVTVVVDVSTDEACAMLRAAIAKVAA